MSVQGTQSSDPASFEAVRDYNWAADQEFQIGLRSILSSASSAEQAATLALRAKCFFYSTKSGIQVNYDAFSSWLAQNKITASNPAQKEPEPIPVVVARGPSHRKQSASILGRPSIDTTTIADSSENFHNNTPSLASPQTGVDLVSVVPNSETVKAPYPTSFAHIVELITTGQPIPGIREIPNILNTAPPSEATKPKRQKPWETTISGSSAKHNHRGSVEAGLE